VLDFVELLETRLGRGIPHKSLSGAWADMGIDLSAEDIEQARREELGSGAVAMRYEPRR
jgi:hypothetical protein